MTGARFRVQGRLSAQQDLKEGTGTGSARFYV